MPAARDCRRLRWITIALLLTLSLLSSRTEAQEFAQDAGLRKLCQQLAALVNEEAAEDGCVVVFPLLQKVDGGGWSSQAGNQLGSAIAKLLDTQTGEREIIHGLGLQSRLAESNRGASDYSHPINAKNLAALMGADFGVTGRIERFPLRSGWGNGFRILLYGCSTITGRVSFQEEYEVLPGNGVFSPLYLFLDERFKDKPEDRWGRDAEPGSADPHLELHTGLKVTIIRLVREHREKIGDRKVAIRPATLPQAAKFRRELDEAILQLTERYGDLEEEAFLKALDLADLLAKRPVTILIGGEAEDFDCWNDARTYIQDVYLATYNVSEASQLERSLSGSSADALVVLGGLPYEQMIEPYAVRAGVPIGQRGGMLIASTPEHEESPLLLLPEFQVIGRTARVVVWLYDPEQGVIATRPYEFDPTIAEKIARLLSGDATAPPEERLAPAAPPVKEPVPPPPEEREHPVEPPVEERPAPPPRPAERPSEQEVLSRVVLVAGYLGSAVDDIARALTNAPELGDCRQVLAHKLGSANEIFPQTRNRCEVRYDRGNPDGRAAADAVLKILLSSSLQIDGGLRTRLKGMRPTLNGVDGDPIQLITGSAAPPGTIAIFVLLKR